MPLIISSPEEQEIPANWCSLFFNDFPKYIIKTYSALVFFNDSKGQKTDEQIEWINTFKNKITKTINDYLLEHERISSLNDHFVIPDEKNWFPSLSLSLNRFTTLTEYGTGKDLSLSEVIGKKFSLILFSLSKMDQLQFV